MEQIEVRVTQGCLNNLRDWAVLDKHIVKPARKIIYTFIHLSFLVEPFSLSLCRLLSKILLCKETDHPRNLFTFEILSLWSGLSILLLASSLSLLVKFFNIFLKVVIKLRVKPLANTLFWYFSGRIDIISLNYLFL